MVEPVSLQAGGIKKCFEKWSLSLLSGNPVWNRETLTRNFSPANLSVTKMSNNPAASEIGGKDEEMETVIMNGMEFKVPRAFLASLHPAVASTSKSSVPAQIEESVVACEVEPVVARKEHLDFDLNGKSTSVDKSVEPVEASAVKDIVDSTDKIIEDVLDDLAEKVSVEKIEIAAESVHKEAVEMAEKTGEVEKDKIVAEKENPEGIENSGDTDSLFEIKEDENAEVDFDKALETLNELKDFGKTAMEREQSSVKGKEVVEQGLEVSSSAAKTKKKEKKSLPPRTLPLRQAKRKSETQEEESAKHKSSVKKSKKSDSNKEILKEIECSRKFFREEGLMEVYELIEAQEWQGLCETKDSVSSDAVIDFYKKLKLVDGPIPCLEFVFRGNKLKISSLELGAITGLTHFGFDQFNKGGHWPVEAERKKDLVQRICGLNKIPKSGSISTVFMEPKVKILHKLLVSNFIQRGAKASYVQHEDLLILDKLLKKERINLPKLIIYQMNHLKNLNQLGFSRIIKKILKIHACYPKSEAEEPVVREFDPEVFRKMKLIKDPNQGWIRSGSPQLIDTLAESEFDEEESEEGSEIAVHKSYMMNTVVREVLAMKTELKSIKEKLSEMEKFNNALLRKIDEGVSTLLKEAVEVLHSRDTQT